jgi:hypothetical protein
MDWQVMASPELGNSDLSVDQTGSLRGKFEKLVVIDL